MQIVDADQCSRRRGPAPTLRSSRPSSNPKALLIDGAGFALGHTGAQSRTRLSIMSDGSSRATGRPCSGGRSLSTQPAMSERFAARPGTERSEFRIGVDVGDLIPDRAGI
jgi:hypothetical protein